MSSVGTPDPNSSWLSDEELEQFRRRIPLLYVEALPVRVNAMGVVSEVGILLRANTAGEITRTLVSGRVMYGETVRDALFRHLEKDLGPMAFPLLPASPVPFQVAEYFPIPGLSAYRRRAAARGRPRVRRPGDRHLRAAAGRARTDLDDAVRGGIGDHVRRDGGRPRVAAARRPGLGRGAVAARYPNGCHHTWGMTRPGRGSLALRKR